MTSKPAGLVPFSIKQKQEERGGSANSKNVAYIRYLDILIYGREYKLVKKVAGKFVFTIDDITMPSTFTDDVNGIKVYVSGNNLMFSTNFGLTVSWDGNHKADVTLCDTYANYVCGLCGNADGNKTNDFVDRKNKLSDLSGAKNTKYYKWGSEWRVADENEPNGST